jgi:hypothetical protein
MEVSSLSGRGGFVAAIVRTGEQAREKRREAAWRRKNAKTSRNRAFHSVFCFTSFVMFRIMKTFPNLQYASQPNKNRVSTHTHSSSAD